MNLAAKSFFVEIPRTKNFLFYTAADCLEQCSVLSAGENQVNHDHCDVEQLPLLCVVKCSVDILNNVLTTANLTIHIYMIHSI